jgi:ribosome-associated protein
MSKEFIESNLSEIINNKKWDFPINAALASAWLIANKKGINIKVLDVRGKTSLTDVFVMASAVNPTQAQSMAEEIVKFLSKFKFKPLSKEGLSESDWTLIDYGDFIVHIFLENSRELYNLDIVWSSAEKVEIPQEFYFDNKNMIEEPSEKSSSSDYF